MFDFWKRPISITKGNLVNGLDSMEKALGLKPGQSAFINEYYASPEFFPDLAEPADWVKGDMAATLAPVVLAGEKATLVTLSCPRPLTNYLASIGLITQGANIIEVAKLEDLTERRFPEGSIAYQMQTNLRGLSSVLSRKTLVPSFSNPEVVACAQAFRGSVLLSPQQSIDFNSKAFLRKVCAEEDFTMPPGMIIEANETLESAIRRFEAKALAEGLPKSPAWLKLPSVAGGGTIPLPQGPDIAAMEAKIIEFMREASSGYTNDPFPENVQNFADIPDSMRREMVLEYDLNALTDVSIEGNFCVQAVVGEKGVTYVGTTGQATEDGEYVGGKTLTAEEEALLKQAMPDIEKVFLAFQKRGYRGYIGVDALVASVNGNIKPFILETNCRMNASTPLLGIVQKLEAQKGKSLYGEMVSFSIPVSGSTGDEAMSEILDYLSNTGLLYQKGSPSGIIPFMPDVFPGRAANNFAKTRCAVVGASPEIVREIRRKIDMKLAL